MNYFIDAHQDIAYNALTFGRDYRLSVQTTRAKEASTDVPARTGAATIGWPEMQQGRVALVIATLFLAPRRYQGGEWDTQSYKDVNEAARLYRGQVDYYRRLVDESPDKFRLVTTRKDLDAVLSAWQKADADEKTTRPVGLVMSMEGAEGIRGPEELEEWWSMGLRLMGPVWAGTRFCGGMHEHGAFTSEGYHLLETMAELGFVLDIAHMNHESSLQALDRYPGSVIASHANANALLKNFPMERHLTDRAIQLLAERDGVMGVMPFNRFLLTGWKDSDDRALVTLDTLAAHIDHVCQLTGSSRHVAVGTDFDGGFGYPAIPLEMNHIADLPKLEEVLKRRGYTADDISAIFHGNWQRILEASLP